MASWEGHDAGLGVSERWAEECQLSTLCLSRAKEVTGKRLGQCCPTTKSGDLERPTSSDLHSFRVN